MTMGFCGYAVIFLVSAILIHVSEAAPCNGCLYKDTCYELGEHFDEGCLMRQCVKRKRDDTTYHFVAITQFNCTAADGSCKAWKSTWDEKEPNRYCAIRECQWWRKRGDWPYTFKYKNKIRATLCIDDQENCHPVEEDGREENPFSRTINGTTYNNCYCSKVNKEVMTSCKP